MSDYPRMITKANLVEPVPRRIRATLGSQTVLDTTSARYVWEWEYYPQYYVPIADVRREFLVDEHSSEMTPRGEAAYYGLKVGGLERHRAVQVLDSSPVEGLSGTAHFEWGKLDAWFEEDERVLVHPRSPYVRVDALRSTRTVRVELEGVVLAESSSPVMVFETGLPTRYYVNRTEVDFTHLVHSPTVTECPYKGTTSGYWSVRVGDEVRRDLAWTYDFPTRQLLPISGMIAFYNEKTDIYLDDQPIDRPHTKFS